MDLSTNWIQDQKSRCTFCFQPYKCDPGQMFCRPNCEQRWRWSFPGSYSVQRVWPTLRYVMKQAFQFLFLPEVLVDLIIGYLPSLQICSNHVIQRVPLHDAIWIPIGNQGEWMLYTNHSAVKLSLNQTGGIYRILASYRKKYASVFREEVGLQKFIWPIVYQEENVTMVLFHNTVMVQGEVLRDFAGSPLKIQAPNQHFFLHRVAPGYIGVLAERKLVFYSLATLIPQASIVRPTNSEGWSFDETTATGIIFGTTTKPLFFQLAFEP